MSSALRALAPVRTLVVHFEDCHWADRSTLDLLAHLASVPSRPPTVVTWRTADPDVSSAHSHWLSRARWAGSTTAVDLLDRRIGDLDNGAWRVARVLGTLSVAATTGQVVDRAARSGPDRTVVDTDGTGGRFWSRRPSTRGGDAR